MAMVAPQCECALMPLDCTLESGYDKFYVMFILSQQKQQTNLGTKEKEDLQGFGLAGTELCNSLKTDYLRAIIELPSLKT